VESDLPERSVRALGPLETPETWPHWPRPVRLLHPPEPVEHVMAPLPDGAPARFRWRGRAYKVAAADGPERLYGEWWRHARERAAIRDYFQVEDETGARFWLFRQGDGEDPATGDLSWHMHGVFA
jgi:protein ImuB